jgi:hypothetical protein
MNAAVPTSTAVFAICPSGQSAASYALAACREPSDIPPFRPPASETVVVLPDSRLPNSFDQSGRMPIHTANASVTR